jgi:hypothetical protein
MSEIPGVKDPAPAGLEMGVITLGEFLSGPRIGRKISAQQRR